MSRLFGQTAKDQQLTNLQVEQYETGGSGLAAAATGPIVNLGPGDFLQVQQASFFTANTNVVAAVPILHILAQSGTSVTQSVGNTFTLQPGFVYRCTAGCPESVQSAGSPGQYCNGFFQWLDGTGQPQGSTAVLRANCPGGPVANQGAGFATMYLSIPSTAPAQVISLQFTYVTIPGTSMPLGGTAGTFTFVGDGIPSLDSRMSSVGRLWATIENVFPFNLPGSSVIVPQILQVGAGSQISNNVGYDAISGYGITLPFPLPTTLFSSGTAITSTAGGTVFTLQPGFMYRCTAQIPESFIGRQSSGFQATLYWLNANGVKDGSVVNMRGCYGAEYMVEGYGAAVLYVSVPSVNATGTPNTPATVSLQCFIWNGAFTDNQLYFIGVNGSGSVSGSLYSVQSRATASIEVVAPLAKPL